MRRMMMMVLALAGCAANADGLDDTATAGLHNVAPEPPEGAKTETRYTLDCGMIKPPEATSFVINPSFTLPTHVIEATIPGFAFDADEPPLAMAVHYRLSDEFIAWVYDNGGELQQRGVESWDSELWFDSQGRALVDCEYLTACKEMPCPPVEEMLDEHGIVYPEKLYGWIQDPIELIVWE